MLSAWYTLLPDMAEGAQQRLETDIQLFDRVSGFASELEAPSRHQEAATVVQILDHLIPQYTTVDVLQDPEIRDGVKAYTQWPTIPQLYVKGEFVGGCDIIREMFQTGELQEHLTSNGVDTAANA